MKLIVVESPTKSKTLQKFVGKDYKIEATMGHVRDLPEKTLGIDIEKDFQPEYVIIPQRSKTISLLKKTAAKAKEVYLAMDPDREGEAIAWHLSQSLNLKKPKRITFHEITKPAIQEAIKTPRNIDLQLVNAQQARRILDRLVGYKLSPFLWKKVIRRLSAGRVQSVTVRLVVERERKIEKFIPQEYWSIEAILKKLSSVRAANNNQQGEFRASLIKVDEKIIPKLGIKTEKEVKEIVTKLKKATYKVSDVERKETKRNPLPPFMTSGLQQESWRRYRLPARTTMSLAQDLYEKGLITYHRSDSLNISNLALLEAKKFIIEKYGENYWAGFLRKYKTKQKTAQEAHEAIRPTYPDKTPEELEKGNKLKPGELRLYELIWKRFIACQMAPSVFDSVRVDVLAESNRQPALAETTEGKQATSYTFRATGQTLRFEGFLKVYPLKFEEKELPLLTKEEALELVELIDSQHFTQPPSRYSEATLIKELEENGIGRPSTYAPIISTIQEKNYIEKDEKKRFKPTEIGIVVNDVLVNHFPSIVDIGFTAKMEEDLDEIADGKKQWVPIIKEFYEPFEKNLKKKMEEVPDKKLTYEKTDKKCLQCGSPLVIKLGRYGKFYACSDWPKCKYTATLEKNTLGIKCPKCKKGEIAGKRTRKRKLFYGCSNWPDCDFASWYEPLEKLCEKCKYPLVKTKRGQIKCSNKDCDYKE